MTIFDFTALSQNNPTHQAFHHQTQGIMATQPNTYTYTPVPHVPYPPLDSPFEVSPAPASTSAQNEVVPLSYQQQVTPKSYAAFQSTLEPDLPAYESGRNQLPVQPPPPPPPLTEQPGRTLEMSTTMPPMTQDWDHGLFGCCSNPAWCLAATFCAPCLYGHTASLLRQADLRRLDSAAPADRPFKQQHHPRHPQHHHQASYINSSCLLFSMLGLVTAGLGACLLTASRRTEVRQRYGIAGEEWDDLCVGCVCLWCGVGQMDMEVRQRVARAGSGGGRPPGEF